MLPVRADLPVLPGPPSLSPAGFPMLAVIGLPLYIVASTLRIESLWLALGVFDQVCSHFPDPRRQAARFAARGLRSLQLWAIAV